MESSSRYDCRRCRSGLVTVLVLLSTGLHLASAARGSIQLVSEPGGGVYGVDFPATEPQLAVQAIHIDHDHLLRNVIVVGEAAYAIHRHDGSLWRYDWRNRRLSSNQATKLVAASVLSYAVDEREGHVFYTTDELIFSAGQSSGKKACRLYVTNTNGSYHRTLVGNGAAVEAVEMAVDSVNGYLFYLSIVNSRTYLISRTSLQGAGKISMQREEIVGGSTVSHLTVSLSHGKAALCWLESTANVSRVYRSRYGLKVQKLSYSVQQGSARHLWSSELGIHTVVQGTSGTLQVVSLANRHFNDATKFELRPSTETLPRGLCASGCPDEQFCLAQPAERSNKGTTMPPACLKPTVFHQKPRQRDPVVVVTAGTVVAMVFPKERDAYGETIVEPLHYDAQMDAGSVAVAKNPSTGDYHAYFTDARYPGLGRVLHSRMTPFDAALFEDKAVTLPNAIAFDPVSNAVLWNSGGRLMEAESGDGEIRTTVVRGRENMNGLVTDSASGLMYWIEGTGVHSLIMQAYLDGSQPKVFHDPTHAVSTPLVLDTSGAVSKLYWCNKRQANTRIFRIAVTHKQADEVVAVSTEDVLGLAIGGGSLFVSSPLHILQRTADDRPYDPEGHHLTDLPSVTSMVYVDFEQQASPRKTFSSCAVTNGFCSGLCLPNGNATNACHCGQGADLTAISMATGAKGSGCRRPDPQVFVAGRTQIRKLETAYTGDFAPSGLSLPPCPHRHKADCFVLTVDPVRHHVYFAVRHGREIFRHSYFERLDTAQTYTKILTTGNRNQSEIGGLAFDATSSNLFWTDSKARRVEVVHIDRTSHLPVQRTVLYWNLDRPKHIVLDSDEGLLFISMKPGNGRSKVVQLGMHRRVKREVIYRADGEENEPLSLAFYKPANALFMTVAANHSILHFDLAHNFRQNIPQSFFDSGIRPVHLTTSRNQLYFTSKGNAVNKSRLYSATIQVVPALDLTPLGIDQPKSQSEMPIDSPILFVGHSRKGFYGACSHDWVCSGLCMPPPAEEGKRSFYDYRRSRCYCPRTTEVDSVSQECRELSALADTLLIATTDGSLRQLNPGLNHPKVRGPSVPTVLSLPPLPLRLPAGQVASVAFNRKTNEVLSLVSDRWSVEKAKISDSKFSVVYRRTADSPKRRRAPGPRQIWVNSVNGYMYVVGGRENILAFQRDVTKMGRILDSMNKPLSVTTDDSTGNLFWLEEVDGRRNILWGASFGHPWYNTIFNAQATMFRQIVAIAASKHRLVFADATTKTICMCVYRQYDFQQTNRDQETCRARHLNVLQENVGTVADLIMSENTLYYTNTSGVYQLELPDVGLFLEDSNTDRFQTVSPARQILAGGGILSVMVQQLKQQTVAFQPQVSACEVNNTCEFFCQSSGNNVVCGCPFKHYLRQDNTCYQTNCEDHKFYCSSRKVCQIYTWACDGACDCESENGGDCFDELDKHGNLCGKFCEGKIPCPRERTCYEPFQRCDGRPDCQSGADEQNCTLPCSRDELACMAADNSGLICVPQSQICDGRRQCRDNEDEDREVCYGGALSRSSTTAVKPGEQPTSLAAVSPQIANILTGSILGFLIVALLGAFAFFYVYQKRREEQLKERRQDHAQQGSSATDSIGTGQTTTTTTTAMQSTGSVSLSEGGDSALGSDSNMSPSRATVGQGCGGGGGGGGKMADGARISSLLGSAEAGHVTAPGDMGTRFIVAGNQSPDTQNDSGLNSCDSHHEYDSDPEEAALEEIPIVEVDDVPDDMIDMFSITTELVTKQPETNPSVVRRPAPDEPSLDDFSLPMQDVEDVPFDPDLLAQLTSTAPSILGSEAGQTAPGGPAPTEPPAQQRPGQAKGADELPALLGLDLDIDSEMGSQFSADMYKEERGSEPAHRSHSRFHPGYASHVRRFQQQRQAQQGGGAGLRPAPYGHGALHEYDERAQQQHGGFGESVSLGLEPSHVDVPPCPSLCSESISVPDKGGAYGPPNTPYASVQGSVVFGTAGSSDTWEYPTDQDQASAIMGSAITGSSINVPPAPTSSYISRESEYLQSSS